jgi:flagellar protein FliS
MVAYQQVNNYLSNHYEGMDPEQLILLLYNGALTRLRSTREGIYEHDVKKRGENLSKAIAIISELNASVDSKMNDESTRFLRSLYTAILTELPKISLNNDLKVLDRAEAYIEKLKEIWEKDVMGKTRQPQPKVVPEPLRKPFFSTGTGMEAGESKPSFQAISV